MEREKNLKWEETSDAGGDCKKNLRYLSDRAVTKTVQSSGYNHVT